MKNFWTGGTAPCW